MEFQKQDLLTLDDNKEYVVVSKVEYQNEFYYYIVDIDNCENLKFVKKNGNELLEINNKELLTNLIPLFINDTNATAYVN